MRLRIFDARHLNSTGSGRKMLRSDYENFSQKLVQKLGKTVTMDENAFFFERESMGSKNCKRLGSVVCRQFDATYDDSCRDKYYVGVASVKDEEEREKYTGYLFYELADIVATNLEDVWRDRYDCVADDDAMVDSACDALFEDFLERFSNHTGINWKILRALSLQNYEGTKFQGKILFIQTGECKNFKITVQGNEAIAFEKCQVRRIRKLLTGCVRNSEEKLDTELALVFERKSIKPNQWRTDSEKMYIMRGYGCPKNIPTAWVVEIEGAQKFKVSFAGHALFRVADSQLKWTQVECLQQWEEIRNRNIFGTDAAQQDVIKKLLEAIENGHHGAAVIFMNLEEQKARNYMENLKKLERCYGVEENMESPVSSLSVMDGAVVVNVKTGKIEYCGVIVDGRAIKKGDMARGARHNSISTFCAYFNSKCELPVAAIVFSEDGGSTCYSYA